MNYNKIFKNFNLETNIDVKNLNTFKIGGKANALIKINSIKELLDFLKLINKYKIKFKIIGNGSNLIFKDKKYNGVLVKLQGDFKKIKIIKNEVVCGSAVNLFILNRLLSDKSLSGLEWSYGIPGTIGGAVFMNAGAYGCEIKDFISKVYVLYDNKLKVLSSKLCNFEYRSSTFKKNKNYIILFAKLKLKFGNKNQIKNTQQEYLNKRIISQPLNFPSAGSVFLRQGNIVPAKLIDEAGFKGFKIGGAMVSDKHAGFIVNFNNAKYKDVKKIIDKISKKIYNDKKVKLITEIEEV